MFKNYLKVTIRTILKSKLFSIINILGLSLGIASCLLILHYVHFENSYDNFHENIDKIYRLRYERTGNDGSSAKFASCTPPAGELIRQRFPEIESLARIFRYRSLVVSHENIKFTEERVFHAEPHIVDIFDFDFIQGNARAALGGVDNVLISQSMAKKYFGNDDPIGKILKVDQHSEFKVSGIFKDVPVNSHIKFDFLFSFQNLVNRAGPEYMENWGHTGMYTYLILKEGTSIDQFKQKLADLVQSEFGEALEYYNMVMELPLQPLRDIHLRSHYMQEFEVNGDEKSVNFLIIIAIFIIIIAWVNYINLTTARSLTRAREVGLRKTIGASRQQLINQFFIEIIILNILSLLVSLLFLQIMFPYFNQLTGIPLTFPFWTQAWVWQTLSLLFIVGVLFSGIYPVLKLSSFNPITTLRGKLGTSVKGIGFRKILVIFQYLIALALITGTMAVYYQIDFMRNKDLGFKINETLVVKAPRVKDDAFSEKIITYKNSLRLNNEILNICMVTEVPGKQIYWDAGAIRKAGEDASRGKNYHIVGIDYDFADVFGINFAAGRNFSKEHPADEQGLIFNETAIRWIGFETPEEAIGKQVDYWGNIFTIIGVISDYHQQSPKQDFAPHIYRLMPEGRHNLALFAINLNSKNISKTIAFIRGQYERLFPGNPFDYFFLDTYFDQQYRSDIIFGKVFAIFAILAIFVTSIGVLGLIAFMVTQRTKEIGIRKVLGADIRQILNILTIEIIRLIMISFILLIPVMYWGIEQWLQSFASKMELSFSLFFIPLLIALIITVLTIAVHVFRAATANPVQALRYE